jgi:alkylation response protein AidB-like acyl-CoA dehydrogenase
LRSEVRDFRDSYLSTPAGERHRLLVESGYLFPHWPKPWGLAAGPVEQLVIDEELSDVDRAGGLGPNAWILPIMLPTLITHGTGEQKQRWIRPSLSGELVWCQLFSEPDAGSDLAALRTSARKVEGGWLVTGSKVWTSTARSANIGFALVRTDSDAPRHAGITCMAIDMHAPGVELRPLRDLGGGEVFYQEFLDEVFVPDTDVIGEVNQGWLVARSTLGNERTSLGEWVNGIDRAWPRTSLTTRCWTARPFDSMAHSERSQDDSRRDRSDGRGGHRGRGRGGTSRYLEPAAGPQCDRPRDD